MNGNSVASSALPNHGWESSQQEAGSNQAARVRIDEPWLSHIVSGRKSYEGRLCRGTWKRLKAGDCLDAYSDKFSHVELIVQDIIKFNDFDDAFRELGKSLLPEGAETPAEALAIYRQWNSIEAVQECGGVVAVGIKVEAVHPYPISA